MASPLWTAYPTPGGVIRTSLATSVMDIPNSLATQKQNRSLALTRSCCLPLSKMALSSISKTLATLLATLWKLYPNLLSSACRE